MNIWVYTGEVNTKQFENTISNPFYTRISLSLNHFDNVGAGEVATRIHTDTRELGFSFISQAISIYLSILQILFSKGFLKRWPSPSAFSPRSAPVLLWPTFVLGV
jgi:hypothetical protein